MWNHSEPIWVSLRHLSPGTDAVAAQWSLKALEKQGSWSQEGCQLIHSDSSTSTVRCSLLSNYAVLQVGQPWAFGSSTIQDHQLLVTLPFMCDFFLGGAWLPKTYPHVCKGAPPCGLCLHCFAPTLPLHRHHHTHTTPQVLQCICINKFLTTWFLLCIWLFSSL